MELNQAVAAVTAALCDSEAVRRLRRARERAKADPTARAAMDRYAVQLKQLGGSGSPPTPAQWQELQRQQQHLTLHAALQEYLAAETVVSQQLQKVMEAAAAACGLDTDAPRL